MSDQDSNTIRVLTVDDHELLRRGIRFSLLPVSDLELVGEAQDVEEAVQLCADLQPDVVLMDMRINDDADGIAATRLIRDQFPQIQVIILSSFYDKELVQGALQAGAIGYLIKGVSGDELTLAIRSAYAGRPTLAAETLSALAQPTPAKTSAEHDLTPREQEVLALLVDGLPNAEIAQRLHVSVAAVKYHLSNIFSKLAVSNRTEAATFALEHCLVPKRE
jgi:NarL family two-component system response regulator LiaR